MSLQLTQLKRTVIETEHSQGFQGSLTRTLSIPDPYPYLQFFLSSALYWCLEHWHRSRTQYSTDALLPSLYTMQFRSYNPPSLCALYTSFHYATHWLAVTRMSISCCLLTSYVAYCISRILSSLPVSPGYPLLEFSRTFSYGKRLAYRHPWRQKLRG